MDQPLGPRKKIGLVAHDSKKADLIEWVTYNRQLLTRHDLVATGTTGTLLEEELGVGIRKLQSGPLGGDQQLGALIADGEIDFLVFFWDPLEGRQDAPDGNIDLRLSKDGQRRIVQCKRWTSLRVGVDEVRSFAGTLLPSHPARPPATPCDARATPCDARATRASFEATTKSPTHADDRAMRSARRLTTMCLESRKTFVAGT